MQMYDLPDDRGHFGPYGGVFVAETLIEAIRRVKPCAVDVSSGVESARGIKDARKIEAFMNGVRNADV